MQCADSFCPDQKLQLVSVFVLTVCVSAINSAPSSFFCPVSSGGQSQTEPAVLMSPVPNQRKCRVAVDAFQSCFKELFIALMHLFLVNFPSAGEEVGIKDQLSCFLSVALVCS